MPEAPAETNGGRDSEIEALLADLDGVVTAEDAAMRLVGYGAEAIEPLQRFLVKGRPSHVFQPRRWAVRALAGLGARDVLLEYIRCGEEISDDEVRLGEEVVQGEAALHLASWGDAEVIDALLGLARRRTIPAVLEALARLREPRAVPLFVRALEDDFSRPAAERVLTELGDLARHALVEAATSIAPNPWDESETSRRRRRSALQILEGTEIDSGCWRQLRPALEDRDAEVRVRTAALALAAGPHADVLRAGEVLLAAIAPAPWFLRDEIEDALVRFFRNRLLDLEQRLNRCPADATEPVARVLRHVRRRL